MVCALLSLRLSHAHGLQAGGQPSPQVAARSMQLIRAGKFGEASDLLNNALKEHPGDSSLCNLLGIAQTELKHLKAAEAAFADGLKLSPNSVTLNENAGLLYFREGDYSRARHLLQRAVTLGSSQPGVRFSLAASKLRTGEQAQALTELIALEPALGQVPEYWEERGRAELGLNASAKAETSFGRALALTPASLIALNGAAGAAERQGLDEKALAYLIRARSVAPDDVPTLLHFASVCIRRDLGPDAIAAAEKARSLDPSNQAAIYLLGRAHISVSDWGKAFDLFSEYARLQPDFASTYYALGWLDIRLNRVEDARRQLEHCLELDPALFDARYELAQLAFDDGQLERAEAQLRRVLQQDPQHAKANTTLGDILERQGKLAEAGRCFERAIRSDPKLAAAHYKLSVVLLREGRPEEAAQEKALAAKLAAAEKRNSKTQLRLVLPDAAADR